MRKRKNNNPSSYLLKWWWWVESSLHLIPYSTSRELFSSGFFLFSF